MKWIKPLWWPYDTISFRYQGELFVDGINWLSYMEVGRENWYNSDAPVDFIVDFGSDNAVEIQALHLTTPWLGLRRVIQRDGTSLLEFEIILNSTRINYHTDHNSRTNYITAIMAHELAHTVGLADNPTMPFNASLMNHRRDRNVITGPADFDVTSVRMLYD